MRMRFGATLLLGTLVAALTALVAATPAWAKGPVKATITGTGLDKPINLDASDTLMMLSEEAGFWLTVFGAQDTRKESNLLTAPPPAKDLGPRYVIEYDTDITPGDVPLRQDLYPFAKPAPLTYAAPDQPLFEGQVSRGGWYRASTRLTDQLISLGVPEPGPLAVPPVREPAVQPSAAATEPWPVPVIIAVAAGVLAVLAVLALGGQRLRHRPARP